MIYVILNTIRASFRNGPTIFFSIFFPSIMTFFLGTLLENIQVADNAVGELNLAYCVEEGGYSANAFEEFILSLDEDSTITAVKIPSEELDSAAEKYSAAVELNGSEIRIYNGTNAIQNRTVKALMDGYNQTAASYMTVAAVNPQALGGIVLSEDNLVEPHDFGRTRSMMDYYAVAMTVVIIFFGATIGGAEAYSIEHSSRTINRLNISPISQTGIFFGKIIGLLPLVLVQVGTVMIVSTVFFGAHYCVTLTENLLLIAMFICCGLAAMSIGVLMNLFFPKSNSWAVLMPIMWIILFFSGAFDGDIYIPGFSEYLPANIMLNAAFDLTVFSRSERAVSVLLWSAGIFAAMLLVCWIKVTARRKEKA